jgi:4-hydroxy-tetrahydrodipicolinate synthase
MIKHAGTWPAMLTPLREDGSIHLDLLAAHAKRLMQAGCAGVTLFGTTGEGPSFSGPERMQALEGLIARGVAAQQILVHTSCVAAPDTLLLTRHATQLGVHGCLILPPYFFKGVSDEGLVAHYSSIFEACADLPLRVVLYHIPQVIGVPLPLAVIARLLERFPRQIIGLKDSGCQRDASVAYAKALMPPMQVWVGNELDVPEMATLGTNGAVSGVANILPELVGHLVAQRDAQSVSANLARTKAFLDLVGGYTMIPAFKGIMAMIDQDMDWLRVRAPLVPLSAEEFERLRAQWQAFKA